MTKSKKRILISVFILFVIWLFLTIWLILTNKNSKENVNLLGIENITTYNKTNISIADAFYVKDEGKKLVIYDLNDEEISTYDKEFTSFDVFDKRYIIIDNGENSVIINKNGSVLKSGNVIKISDDNKYILVDDTIYNYNLVKIYKLDASATKSYYATFKNDLFIYESSDNEKDNVVIDLAERKVLWEDFSSVYSFSFYHNNETYYVITLNNINYLFDVNTKKIVYENINIDENYYDTFTYKGNTYYVDDKIYGDNTKISDKYVMKKDTCSDGYKLKDLNGKTITNKCMNGYKVLYDDTIVGLDKDYNNILFYKDKEIEGAVFTLEGDYIKVDETVDLLGDGTKHTYYDKDLKQIDIDEYTSLYYIGNGYYYSYNIIDRSYYFYDKNLNKVSDKLNSIFCYENTYCDVTTDEHTHYLYKDAKKVFNEKLTNIKINDNEILIETLYKTYILKLGKSSNIKFDLTIDFNIDIDEIINKYDLKSDELTINKNEELFIKYAYLVENSNSLMDYKKEVFDLFKVIVDNSKYLDEFYFLSKLGKLNIIHDEVTYNLISVSTYEDYITRVSLSSNQDFIVYHELMHFIDESINDSSNNALYKCDEKYKIMNVSENGYDSCEYVDIESTNFITEAGAEIFTAKYETKEIKSLVYEFAANYLEGLEYIYGSEEIDKWYFGAINNFYIVLLNDFGDIDKVNEIITALNATTSLKAGPIYEAGYLLDILIDLYKKHIGDDYLSDKKFSFILRSVSGNDYLNTSKYYDEFKSVLDMDYGSLNDLKDNIEYERFGDNIDPVIIDDKMYLSWSVSKISALACAVIWIDYDFEEDVVKDYYIKKEISKVWE